MNRERVMHDIKNTLPMSLLCDIPPGEWVALSHNQDRVLAHSIKLENALTEARRNGEQDPFVMRAPGHGNIVRRGQAPL